MATQYFSPSEKKLSGAMLELINQVLCYPGHLDVLLVSYSRWLLFRDDYLLWCWQFFERYNYCQHTVFHLCLNRITVYDFW